MRRAAAFPLRSLPARARRASRRAAVAAVLAALAGCANPMVRTADAFRAAVVAGDVDAARACLSDDPRTWYGSREGPGDPWVLGGGRWKAWDEEFNGASQLGPWHVGDRRVFAVAVEDNDYYRAIEREPSPWLLTYFFDDEGRIDGRLVSSVPESLRPPGEPKPDRGDAFDAWLLETHPEEHAYLRPGGRIDPTDDRAARTRALLAQWRAEVGLPPLAGR